ncbi:MAG: Flp pilus assembly complex ATPase component TadA [Phycisphaerales bacterium]|nr:MAG: Flp pilus assembly complex ATPase component TadA [Phycisphaerales bacterium]
MNSTHFSLVLAALSEGYLYVNLIKVGVVVALVVGWAYAAQWIDRDTDTVKTKREQWNLIVISGAFVGFIALFVPPWYGVLYFVGLGFWLVLAGGAMVAYIIHRNGRMVPAARVLTIGHVKRLVMGDPSKKKSAQDKGQRVLLMDHEGTSLSWPEDPEEAYAYEAVQDFLHDLLWRRATEVDLSAGKEDYRLVYRIDGVGSEKPEGIPSETGDRILRYLKKIAGLNVEEIRRPQSGKIQTALLSHAEQPGRTLVNTSGTTAGERIRLKIETGVSLKRLHELGVHPQRLQVLKTDILGKSTGLFLMSAPPGHGLTTSQYAVLRGHDAFMHNIHALERHALLDLDNITQQVYEGTNADVNYARMLQTVLRRDPDIVLVDVCEDRETAVVATRAAAEDRKIYLGIHAKDCLDASSKYLAFLGEAQLAGKALRGVMNQRLVRILCTECREAFRPDPATLKKLNLPVDKIERFYRPPAEPKRDRKGKEIPCPNCQGTGYLGRVGVFEIMPVDEEIARLIAAGAAMSKIKAQARKKRMYYLQEEGLLKVIDGTTSMNEVLRCLRTDEKK